MTRLSGAWEPDHIGPRAEISGRKIVILWRGAPVLTTTFTPVKDGPRTVLRLAKTGLQYAGSAAPYAEVTECFVENGALTVREHFPITGPGEEVMRPTTNTRYGDADPDPGALRALRGRWVRPGSDEVILIRGRRLFYGWGNDLNDRVGVVALRSRSDGSVRLADRDPSRDGVGPFGPISVEGDALRTWHPVCDAPNVPIEFVRAGRLSAAIKEEEQK